MGFNPHTETDTHYHLHLLWSLRGYPLTGSPSRPYAPSLSIRRDWVKDKADKLTALKKKRRLYPRIWRKKKTHTRRKKLWK